ncbi:hypothetical protein [Celerinatantimonas sp. YJH-8]|uniref:hypothetical protein n=1 Tax=Celerinatantimonas sp. YJH-8 TaxID=3228714 RepID=UPI0038C8A279
MKLNHCCDTSALQLIKRVYESNADVFEVLQCPDCHGYWLYRYLEKNWFNNLQLKENEYEAWFIPLKAEELAQIYAMQLSHIQNRAGYMHITTIAPLTKSVEWARLLTPLE